MAFPSETLPGHSDGHNQGRIFGNRCYHDRRNPRLEVRHSEHWLKQDTMDALDRLWDSDEFATAIGRARSERRERCIRTLKSLVFHTELRTLRVGITYADGTFCGTSHEMLLEVANHRYPASGERRLSKTALQRSLRDIRKTPLLVTKKQPREEYIVNGEKKYAAGNAIRVLARGLWDFIKRSVELKKARDYDSAEYTKERKRLEAVRASEAEAARPAIAAMVRQIGNQRDLWRERDHAYGGPLGELTPAEHADLARTLYRLKVEHEGDPEWTKPRLRQAAYAEVRRRREH